MCVLIFFCLGPTKKMIQLVEYMPNFKGFCPLDKKLCGTHNFEKKEVKFGGNIISSEISTVGLTQIDFNRR